jgi:hypothetical protein
VFSLTFGYFRANFRYSETAQTLEEFENNRCERLEYQGSVRLFIPFDPWRIMINLRAENISSTGLLATLKIKSTDLVENESLICEGEIYDLQLEHDYDYLPSPVISATLIRAVKVRNSYELGFSFTEPDAELLSMLHEIQTVVPQGQLFV